MSIPGRKTAVNCPFGQSALLERNPGTMKGSFSLAHHAASAIFKKPWRERTFGSPCNSHHTRVAHVAPPGRSFVANDPVWNVAPQVHCFWTIAWLPVNISKTKQMNEHYSHEPQHTQELSSRSVPMLWQWQRCPVQPGGCAGQRSRSAQLPRVVVLAIWLSKGYTNAFLSQIIQEVI